MKDLLKYFEKAEETIPEVNADEIDKIIQTNELTIEIAKLINEIYQNKSFKDLMEKATDVQCLGGVEGLFYYFEHANRFAADNFQPTQLDVLKGRRRTTGIVETHFNVGPQQFTMVDVGGQRSERKKWLHCFEGVTAVLYLTALNEYDLTLEEDGTTNRFVESLKLWKALTLSNFFKLTPFILFLNKSDLFKEKIKKYPLKDSFSDYEKFVSSEENISTDEFETAWKYISKQYRNNFSGQKFYVHLTCALDTDNCKKVFDSIVDTLLETAMQTFQ